MSQARTKQGSITFIMSRKAFALGFKTAVAGEGWPSEYDRMETRDQWFFEYGRMLGAYAPHVTLKHGRTVTREAQRAFVEAAR